MKYQDFLLINGPNFLESSPSGFSIFIIFAPRSPKIEVAKGPDSTLVMSRTITPLSGIFSFLFTNLFPKNLRFFIIKTNLKL